MLSFIKTIAQIITVSLAAAILCPGTALLSQAAEQKPLCKGSVTAHRLNLRAEPSRFSDVVIILEKNDIVDVYEKKGGAGGWLQVRYENYRGYLRNRPQYIRLIPLDAVTGSKTAVEKKPAEDLQVVKKRQQITKKIEKEQEKISSFSGEESKIIEGLNEIDFALNRARVNAASLSEDIRMLSGKIDDIKARQKKLSSEVRKNTGYAGKRLDALYRLNMIGRLEIAGPPRSIFDFFLKQRAMKRVIQSDFQVIEKQVQDMKQLAALGETLEEQYRVKLDLEKELEFQIRIKEQESRKKETILSNIRSQKKLALAAVESLKEAARQLDTRIGRMKQPAGRQQAGHLFTDCKGRLQFPVQGNVISRFGPSKSEDYGSFTFQSGIDIKTERGEPVKSVFNGEILFAEWLKGYGNVIIVNHGENYYSLYAHLEEIFKAPGEKVETGEVIATAGDTGSIKGLCLHFELRHHGKPIDPLKWLQKGA